MRTTIDLPEDLHRVAVSLAHHKGQSLSQTVVELMRLGLQRPAAKSQRARSAIHPSTGLPVFKSARIITPGDVKAREEE